jgi:phage shock protein C
MSENEAETMSPSGGEKTCPYCAEKIRAEAVKCRYCGTMLEPSRVATGLSQPWVRPREGRKIAGVCAGLAEHLGLSVTLLRLGFLLGFLVSGGVFLLVYVALWIVMVDEWDVEPPATSRELGPTRLD